MKYIIGFVKLLLFDGQLDVNYFSITLTFFGGGGRRSFCFLHLLYISPSYRVILKITINEKIQVFKYLEIKSPFTHFLKKKKP